MVSAVARWPGRAARRDGWIGRELRPEHCRRMYGDVGESAHRGARPGGRELCREAPGKSGAQPRGAGWAIGGAEITCSRHLDLAGRLDTCGLRAACACGAPLVLWETRHPGAAHARRHASISRSSRGRHPGTRAGCAAADAGRHPVAGAHATDEPIARRIQHRGASCGPAWPPCMHALSFWDWRGRVSTSSPSMHRYLELSTVDGGRRAGGRRGIAAPGPEGWFAQGCAAASRSRPGRRAP